MAKHNKEEKINKVALVYDYGNFCYVAEVLARTFSKVYLRITWEKSYPKANDYIVGTGLENVIKIENEWDVFDEVDIWVFPDLHFGAFQRWLKSQDKNVFGACMGEIMENERDTMENIMKEVGLPVSDGKRIEGFSDLISYLEDTEDLYIKSNTFRGDHETWHHENYDLSKPILDELGHSLGVAKEKEIFLAKEPIEYVVEIGFDGFCVNGYFTDKTIFGIEIKDTGYFCSVMDYDDLPKVVQDINVKLAHKFKEQQYTGWYSNEIRAKNDSDGFLTDQTCRFGEPPTALASNMIKNFAECVQYVAEGEIPDLKFDYKYGVMLVIKSEWAMQEPQAIYYPKELDQYVMLKNKCIIDGVTYYVPKEPNVKEIGAVIACSNNLEDAFLEVVYRAKQIKGYGISIDTEVIDKFRKEIDKLNDKKISNNF